MTTGTRKPTWWARLLPAAAAEVPQGSFFLLEGRLRQGNQARSLEAAPEDEGTTRTLTKATMTSALAAPSLALARCGRLPAQWGWAGVGLMLTGLALRIGSARSLGTHYTRTLRVSDDHTLVTTGPYARVRHPGYAGMLAMWAGYGIAWTNMLSAAVSAGASVAGVRNLALREFAPGHDFVADRDAQSMRAAAKRANESLTRRDIS